MRIRKNKRRIDPRYFLHETQINEEETTESEKTEPEAPEAPEAVAPPPEEEVPGRNERQKQKHRKGLEFLKDNGYDGYEDFYDSLATAGLTGKLGRASEDKIWGKKHQQAWDALMVTDWGSTPDPESEADLDPEEEAAAEEAPIETSATATGEEITPETLKLGAAEVAKQKRDARIAKRSDRHRRRVAKQTGRDPVTGEKARVVDTANTQLFLMTKGQKGRVEPPKIVLPGEPEYDDARDAEPGDPTYQEKETGGVTLEPSKGVKAGGLTPDTKGRRVIAGSPEEKPIPVANLGDVALAGELQGGSAQAVDEAVALQIKMMRSPGLEIPEQGRGEFAGKVYKDARGNEYREYELEDGAPAWVKIKRDEYGLYKSHLPVRLTDDEIAGLRETPPKTDAELLKLMGKQQLDKVSEVGIRALVSAQKNGSKHAGAILNGMGAGLRDRERRLDKDIRTIKKTAERITKLKNILQGEERLGNPDPEYTREVEKQLRNHQTNLYWREQNVKETQAKVGRLRKMLTLGEADEIFTPSDREALEKATAEEEMHSPDAARARTEKKWAEEEAARKAAAEEAAAEKTTAFERERERRRPAVRMDESLNRNTRNIKIRINKRRRK